MRDLLTDREAAKILNIRIDRLYETVDFFDRFDDDPWELIEGDHFEFVQQTGDYQERRFTEEGVEAIARYLDGETAGIFAQVMELLTHRKRKRKQMLVSRRITQEFIETNGIVKTVGQLVFVDRPTTIKILQTNSLGINNSINRLFKSDSLDGQEGLEIEKHFVMDENREKAWSQKGLASIALDMKENAKITKARRAWMSAIGEVVDECFKKELKRLNSADLRIARAIRKAKRAAKDTCQVTGARRARGRDLTLDGHHLFDKSNRPDLADLHENILVMESGIHADFHCWQSRRDSTCEPKDFLEYLETARFDLIDPTNTANGKRHYALTEHLLKLQKNFQGNKLHYGQSIAANPRRTILQLK